MLLGSSTLQSALWLILVKFLLSLFIFTTNCLVFASASSFSSNPFKTPPRASWLVVLVYYENLTSWSVWEVKIYIDSLQMLIKEGNISIVPSYILIIAQCSNYESIFYLIRINLISTSFEGRSKPRLLPITCQELQRPTRWTLLLSPQAEGWPGPPGGILQCSYHLHPGRDWGSQRKEAELQLLLILHLLDSCGRPSLFLVITVLINVFSSKLQGEELAFTLKSDLDGNQKVYWNKSLIFCWILSLKWKLS